MQQPLAEKFRPQSLSEVVGQDHILGPKGFITRTIKSGRPLSIILWGPPGSGKTSIARLYAKAFDMRFHVLSAVFSGVADIKAIVKEAESQPLLGGVLLFVDEIHRFNKSQQDAFLPYLEKGSIVLVGATVENPSFYLNNALLSRVRVLTLNTLNEADLEILLKRYEDRTGKLKIDKEGRQFLIQTAQGDGRYLYNLIENIENVNGGKLIDLPTLKTVLQKRAALYDKEGEQHYNLISALHKSVRGSDPDAALYWFARMLEGGEEPLYIARRLIRIASEDVGQADPFALQLAIAASDAYQLMGSPEGELALAQVVIYLSLAPKSNATYTAYSQARAIAAETTHLGPPLTIRNAPTGLMKKMGYGKGYIYDPSTPEGFSGQNYFPEGMERKSLYNPTEKGFESEMKKRMEYYKQLRQKMQSSE